jgi:two-component system KDP operon response regulator KdpE
VTTVLVVEDDAPLRRTLATMLQARGFGCIESESGEAGLRAAAAHRPDLVLLDLSLPGIDGTQVLRELRRASAVPIVVLTVRDGRRDKVEVLDAGADDYVVKPFDSEELLARVRAALRRHRRDAVSGIVVADELEIDLDRRLVRRSGDPVHLTRTELIILETLVSNPAQLITYEHLASRLGQSAGGDSASLRVHLGNLRRKLHDDAARPRFIVTEPGLGYRWVATASADHP